MMGHKFALAALCTFCILFGQTTTYSPAKAAANTVEVHLSSPI
jgi:hypothetical protein